MTDLKNYLITCQVWSIGVRLSTRTIWWCWGFQQEQIWCTLNRQHTLQFRKQTVIGEYNTKQAKEGTQKRKN